MNTSWPTTSNELPHPECTGIEGPTAGMCMKQPPTVQALRRALQPRRLLCA